MSDAPASPPPTADDPADSGPVRLRVRGLAHGGQGVAEPLSGEGPVWFLPGTWPGDVVEAEAEHRAARFVRGRVLSIVEPSPDRVDPPCPLAGTCGGCDWQHAAASVQGPAKRTIVAEQLRHVCGDEKVRLEFDGPAEGYRRRARLHYARLDDGAFALGFRASGSHAVVDHRRCPVLVEALDRGMQRVRALAGVLPEQGDVLGLTDGHEVVLGLPGVRPSAALEAAASEVLDELVIGIEVRGGRQRATYGRRWLDVDGGGRVPPLRVGPFSFVQAQVDGGRELVRYVVRMARPAGARVLELFAGAGNFTRVLALQASRVWASDSDRDAVDALQNLAKVHGLPINAKKQSATGLLPKLAASGQRYPVAVVDPPRAGVGQAGMRDLCKVVEERLVYVSCDPATLARDLAVATDHGFEVVAVGVFDLMPMTSQVEVVATLQRRGGGR